MDLDNDEPIAGQYNDGNRAFLQAFMARGSMTTKTLRPLLAAIFSVQEDKDVGANQITEADIQSFVSAASAALSPFDYEIRSTVHQITNETVYALVNSASDPLTQLATTYTSEEIGFLKRLLDAMFETYNTKRQEVMAVTSMQALKFAKGPGRQSGVNGNLDGESQTVDKGLSYSQAEKMLASLVAQGWFERSDEGWYSLSARSLLELKNWLLGSYNDGDDDGDDWQKIKSCEACKSIVTVGQRCSDPDCTVRLHDICDAAFWRTRRGDGNRCPRCDREWDGRHFVGERAITTTEVYLRGRRRSGGGTSQTQRRTGRPAEHEEDEDEE